MHAWPFATDRKSAVLVTFPKMPKPKNWMLCQISAAGTWTSSGRRTRTLTAFWRRSKKKIADSVIDAASVSLVDKWNARFWNKLACFAIRSLHFSRCALKRTGPSMISVGSILTSRGRPTPSLTFLLAQVISSLTASLRFDGALNVDILVGTIRIDWLGLSVVRVVLLARSRKSTYTCFTCKIFYV